MLTPISRHKLSATIHVDSRVADDSGSGTVSSPKKTIAAAVAKLKDGGSLSLARTGRWHEAVDLTGLKFIDIVAHGEGEKPIIDGSRLIPANAWHADPNGRAGVYYADVTHSTAMGSLAGIVYQYMLFEETPTLKPWETKLVRKFNGGSITANKDWIRDHPGSFTVHGQGDNRADPSDLGFTAVRYWISTRDGSNPATNGIPVYYCEAGQLITFGPYGTWTDGIYQRCAGKDPLGILQFGPVGKLTRIHGFDVTCHGMVLHGADYEDCHVRGTYREYEQAGGGFTLYRSATDNGPGNTRMIGCTAENFSAGILEHGNGVSPYANYQLYIRDSKFINCRHGIVGGPWQMGVDIDGVEFIGCLYGWAGQGAWNLKNIKYISAAGSWQPQSTIFRSLCVVYAGAVHNVENATVIFINDGTSGQSSPEIANVKLGGVLNLTRCTVVGASAAQSPNEREGAWNLIDCILGNIGGSYGAATEWPIAQLTATNSQFDFGGKTLQEIQTQYPGVDDTCIVPFYRQPFVHVVANDEFAYSGNLAGYESYGVAGNQFVRVSSGTSGANFGRVRIPGVGSGGGDLNLVGYHLDPPNNGGGRVAYSLGHNYTVLPNTFNNVPWQAAYFTEKIFPQYAGTARLYPELNKITLSNPEHFSVGQYIRLGAVPGRSHLGLFKITALAGSLATLDRDVKWHFVDVGGGDTQYATPTINGQPGPDVPVYFGFPLVSRNVSGRVGLSGEIQRVEGGEPFSVSEDAQYSVAASFNIHGQQPNYDQYRNDTGELTAGFSAIAGDTISISWLVKIAEFEPRFVSSPAVSKDVSLVRTSLLSELGMGYQGSYVRDGSLGDSRYGDFDYSTLPMPNVATWGLIDGAIADQADLQSAINAKLNLSGGTLTGDLSGTKLKLGTVNIATEVLSVGGNAYFRSPSGAQIYLADPNFDSASYYTASPGIGAVGGVPARDLGIFVYADAPVTRALVGTFSSVGLTLPGSITAAIGRIGTSPGTGLVVGATGNGRLSLKTGDTLGTAYIEWLQPNGTRSGYIGYDFGTDVGVHVDSGRFICDAPLTINGPLVLAVKTIATLPSAASSAGMRFRVSDSPTVGGRVAFSDGTAWYYEGTPVAV